MTSRTEVLARVRTRQQSVEATEAEPAKAFRIILEFAGRPDPAEVDARIEQTLGIRAASVPLSHAHGEDTDSADDGLARFVATTVVGVAPADVADAPFELGYALADATEALTAEPELGTNFFIVPRDSEAEGLDGFPPGCWVDAAHDPTAAQPLWAVKKIKAWDAWQLPPPAGGRARGEGVRVFQPDTGVADHIELEAGMIDASRAFDFIANTAGAVDPMDYIGNPGHGTGTASVVASRVAGTIAGSAPLATLVPLRAVTSVIVLDHGRVAAAVEYARRKGAGVITMSLGGAWSSALRAAIRKALADGVIVLAAAGNCVKIVVWPARYEEVIAVAGFNIADQPWIGSCSGDAVDITAPGEFVPRANRAPSGGGSPSDVRGGQGTSFSVALTAGVAALWLAYHGGAAIKAALRPGETVQDRFVALLKATAWRPEGDWDDGFGAGIVDAEALLQHGLQPPADAVETTGAEMAGDGSESLRSVQTALAELGAFETMGSPVGPPASRRYAAELSHLVLAKQKRRTQGGLESVASDPPMSDTLQAELVASGRADLLTALQ